jgi:hypothetical protein
VSAQVEEAKAGVSRTQAQQRYRQMQHQRVGLLLAESVINKRVIEIGARGDDRVQILKKEVRITGGLVARTLKDASHTRGSCRRAACD